ncbi:MAG: SDR family NAD(P)-dependent oxidoreductase [Pseudomonadota bacterium]
MNKTILLTGATDGIGLETAKRLATTGNTLLLHGRNESKLAATKDALSAIAGVGHVETFSADLSDLDAVNALADSVTRQHTKIDILINNAGVFTVAEPVLPSGQDVRFVVNTLAPYLLTRRLLPHMTAAGRVVNLSSAAQAPVSLAALEGKRRLSDHDAYAQSKLAITMWSIELADELGQDGPAIIAVNPASLLGSKMVKDAYGTAGKDLGIGADVLIDAALGDRFADASGRYFDNDSGRFANPHPDALDARRRREVVNLIDALIG